MVADSLRRRVLFLGARGDRHEFSPRSWATAEDRYAHSLGNAGTRLSVFVDAQGRIIE